MPAENNYDDIRPEHNLQL